MIAKIFMVHHCRKQESFVFQHSTDDIAEARTVARQSHPEFRQTRVWLGEQDAHKCSVLNMNHSPRMAIFLEKGGNKKLYGAQTNA